MGCSKKKIVDSVLFAAVLAQIALLIIFNRAAMSAARNAISLCGNIVIPSIFPFMVLSTILMRIGHIELLGKPFAKVSHKLFRLPPVCFPVIMLGFLSGFPIGAKMTAELYDKGQCTKNEAERLLSFCNNAGVIFVFGAVGIGIWQSAAIGALLWLAQFLSAIITGVIVGRIFTRKTNSFMKQKINAIPASIFSSITESVKSSAIGIINVCAFIVFFSVFISIIKESGILPAISRLFGNTKIAEDILTGLVEMTSGVYGIGSTATRLTFTVTGVLIGWSGLSVHCQVLSYIESKGISVKPYFFGKTLQTLISGVITYLMSFMIRFDRIVPTITAFRKTVATVSDSYLIISVLALFFLFFLLNRLLYRKF